MNNFKNERLKLILEIPLNEENEKKIRVSYQNEDLTASQEAIFKKASENFLKWCSSSYYTKFLKGLDEITKVHCLDLIKIGINAGIDPKAIRDDEGKGPLHYAAGGACTEIVKYLVEEAGLDLRDKDNLGNTPLHYAFAEKVRSKFFSCTNDEKRAAYDATIDFLLEKDDELIYNDEGLQAEEYGEQIYTELLEEEEREENRRLEEKYGPMDGLRDDY